MRSSSTLVRRRRATLFAQRPCSHSAFRPRVRGHLIDGLVQFGLETQPWFPGFLERIKALNMSLRNHGDSLQEELDNQGFDVVASMVENTSFKYFAKWRWGTLFDVAAAIQSIHATLRMRLDEIGAVNRRIK